MSDSLLNENQRRRVSTNLQLLEDEMGALSGLPELGRDGATYDRVRSLIDEIVRTATTVRQALALGEPLKPSLRRRVGAVGEIWAVRIEDLMAQRLTGYGAVHPGLAAQLDPPVTALVALLERLAAAATRLPET